MSKTKRGKTRQPNPVKPAPQKQLGQDATTMRVVDEPVLGRFYAVDYRWWNENDDCGMIALYSGRREPGKEYYLDFKAANPPLLQGSAHSQRPENMDIWLKVIYQDMIGWIDMEHVQMIFELDPDDNGDMVEKQVYPYASDD